MAGVKIAKYLIKAENKILKGTNQNDTHDHEHNPTHNVEGRLYQRSWKNAPSQSVLGGVILTRL